MALDRTIVFHSTFCLLIITTWVEGAAAQWFNHGGDDAEWLNHGGDLSNRRYAEREKIISPVTASGLRLKWKFFAGKDISATPSISDGTLYFPSWNGYLYAIDAFNGSLVWEKNLQELTGLNGTGAIANVPKNVTVSRATPTVVDDLLIIGIYGPAVVIAVDRGTGNLVWSTQLDSNPLAVITMSGTPHKRGFYVGTSSLEEGLSADKCCTFRGSMLKLDIRLGAILWRTYTIPDNGGKLGGYAGAAIWGSSPAIDLKRNLVYVATGNMYSAPPEIIKCQEEQNNLTVPTSPDRCIVPENHLDSILAFDMDSGKIRWFRQLGGYDVWLVLCIDPSNPDCPTGPNPDADFGEAPMLLSVIVNGTKRDIAVAVQKSGFAWALDRDNGDIVWSSAAGPGGYVGGGTWGASTDGRIVYTNIVNNEGKNFTLTPSGKVTTGGGWVALDGSTGKVLWSTANPTNATSNGPVTLANGVLLVGSTDPQGHFYAINAESGDILWSNATGATVYGGASVHDGCFYVGNGYTVSVGASVPSWTPGTSLYAFCIE